MGELSQTGNSSASETKRVCQCVNAARHNEGGTVESAAGSV